MPSELGEHGKGRVGMRPLEHFPDLSVEDPKSALCQRPIDTGAELLLREREPLSPGPLAEDPDVNELLDFLGKGLLTDPHSPEQEREIELRTDGARVGEDPVLLGREGIERTGRALSGGMVPCRSVHHRLLVRRRSELSTCLGTDANQPSTADRPARVI
jgi:hypothetical protein